MAEQAALGGRGLARVHMSFYTFLEGEQLIVREHPEEAL
jgi:hypothetical protein